MLGALKFGAFVIINFMISLFGTAILESALRRTIPVAGILPHSVAGILWKGTILSIICAAGIGFSVWRVWRNSAAKWAWVLPAVWFFVGLLTTAGRGDVFGRMFGFGSGSLAPAEARSFIVFTFPFIRGICYSLGALISSSIFSKTIVIHS